MVNSTNATALAQPARSLLHDLLATRTASVLRLLMLVAITAALVGSVAAVLFVGVVTQLGSSNR